MLSLIEEYLLSYHGTPDVDSVDPKDARSLAELVVSPGIAAIRVRILSLLVSAGVPGTLESIGRILSNSEEDPSLRASAASHAARIGGVEAEQLLISNIRRQDAPLLLSRIALALARIGSPESIHALKTLTDHEERWLCDLIVFSTSVIAYRHGIAGFELPVTKSDDQVTLDTSKAWPFTVSNPSFTEFDSCVPSFPERYGITLSRQWALAVSCGRERMAVFLHASLLDDSNLKRIREGPALLGFVAVKNAERRGWFAKWLIFSWPHDSKKIWLAAHRLIGRRMMFGSIELSHSAAHFELTTVKGPGQIAARICGQTSEMSLKILEALSSRSRSLLAQRGKRIPNLEDPQYLSAYTPSRRSL